MANFTQCLILYQCSEHYVTQNIIDNFLVLAQCLVPRRCSKVVSIDFTVQCDPYQPLTLGKSTGTCNDIRSSTQRDRSLVLTHNNYFFPRQFLVCDKATVKLLYLTSLLNKSQMPLGGEQGTLYNILHMEIQLPNFTKEIQRHLKVEDDLHIFIK